MHALLEDAARRAMAYLEGLDRRSVAPAASAIAALDAFDQPFPERGTDPRETLALLDRLEAMEVDGKHREQPAGG